MALIGELVTRLKADATQFNSQMALATSRGQEFGNRMKTVGKVVGIAFVAMAASAALVIREIVQVAEEIDKLAKRAKKFGGDVSSFQRLEFVASLAGVEISKLESGMSRLVKGMADAKRGVGEAGEAFDTLGLSVSDLDKMSVDKQYLAIAEAINKIPAANKQAQLSVDLFGRSGVEQLNLLREVSKKSLEEFDSLGLSLSNEQAGMVEQLDDNLTRLGAVWGGFKDQVVVALAEPFGDFLEDLKTAIQEMGGFKEIAKDVAIVIRDAFESTARIAGSLINLLNSARRAGVAARIQLLESQRDSLSSKGSTFGFNFSRSAAQVGSKSNPEVSSLAGIEKTLEGLNKEYSRLTISSDKVDSVFNKLFDRGSKGLTSFIEPIFKASDKLTDFAGTVEKSNSAINGMIDGIKGQKVGEELQRILGVEIQQAFGGLSRAQIETNNEYAKQVKRANPNISDAKLQASLPFQTSSQDTTTFDASVRGLFTDVQSKKISSQDFSRSIGGIQSSAVGLGPQFTGVVDELRKFGEAAGLVSKQAQKLEITVSASKGFDLQILNSENIRAYIKDQSKIGIAELTEVSE